MGLLFVDESKAKGYTMVAVVVTAADVADRRREMRALVLRGQRRIHLTSESDSRRRTILSTLTGLGTHAHVVHCASGTDAIGRARCVSATVDRASTDGHERIVLERDQSLEPSDRRVLYREIARRDLRESISYAHETAHQEPLLWIADALAWSYSRGGEWRRRIAPMVEGVEALPT
ncbi:hypothetical protein [Clavibacter californiensis]|uniref:DUF3800 domain-containing protein n=1 Tax=Clavibacter californiensis TaxID=1401995 RepID=A0ABX9N3M6_9MICO|nr:hypothetical protein [Clavibacter californiensis]RII90725.1 hypothetical protein DZF98_11140 [Clavibacter californiensis]UKF80350.1 hypothetical protein FGD68_01460 [Clavibacter californiensis]